MFIGDLNAGRGTRGLITEPIARVGSARLIKCQVYRADPQRLT
jgi:hypothetical protein